MSSEAERRKHDRVADVVLVVRFAGETYTSANWSMGGFLLNDYQGPLSTGALVTVTGLGKEEERLVAIEVPARVVRTGESTIAVNYLSMDANAHEFLQAVMREAGRVRVLLD